MQWYGAESGLMCDYCSICGDSLKPFGVSNDSLQRSPVVCEELRVFSSYGIVLVPYCSYNRVLGG